MAARKRLIIVSGLSGSGKTVALHVLEDIGYYCIDNLPASLIESAVDEVIAAKTKGDLVTHLTTEAAKPQRIGNRAMPAKTPMPNKAPAFGWRLVMNIRSPRRSNRLRASGC